MKHKLLLATVCTCAISLTAFANISLALTNADGGETGEIIITDSSTTPNATLEFTTSPGVWLMYSMIADEFSIATANANAQQQYRMEYGIWSLEPGYYQKQSTTASVAGNIVEWASYTPDGGTTAPFGGYTYMGNSN